MQLLTKMQSRLCQGLRETLVEVNVGCITFCIHGTMNYVYRSGAGSVLDFPELCWRAPFCTRPASLDYPVSSIQSRVPLSTHLRITCTRTWSMRVTQVSYARGGKPALVDSTYSRVAWGVILPSRTRKGRELISLSLSLYLYLSLSIYIYIYIYM